jgi:hypothetical protein
VGVRIRPVGCSKGYRLSMSLSTDDPAVDTIVLVEGRSDVAALRVLAPRLQHTAIVSLEGVTKVGRYVREAPTGIRLLGLCDAPEVRFFERVALEAFFVCHDDLEDEFIRSLGTARVEAVIEGQGELAALAEALTEIPRPLRELLALTS